MWRLHPEASITAVFVTSLTDVRPISVLWLQLCVVVNRHSKLPQRIRNVSREACYDAMLRYRLAICDLNNTGNGSTYNSTRPLKFSSTACDMLEQYCISRKEELNAETYPVLAPLTSSSHP